MIRIQNPDGTVTVQEAPIKITQDDPFRAPSEDRLLYIKTGDYAYSPVDGDGKYSLNDDAIMMGMIEYLKRIAAEGDAKSRDYAVQALELTGAATMNDLTMAMALAPMFAQSGSSGNSRTTLSLPKLEKLCDQLSHELEDQKYQQYKKEKRQKQIQSMSCVTVEPEGWDRERPPEEIKVLINGT